MEELSRITEESGSEEILTGEETPTVSLPTETDEKTNNNLAEQSEVAEEEKVPVSDTEEPECDSRKDGSSTKETKVEEKRKKIYSVFDFVELFIFTFVAVLVVTSFFFRHSIVDGPSMEGTLKDGEVLILSNFMYTPEQFDIVVVEDYTTLLKKPIVKRVIATEGQSVKIDRNGVWVDGSFLQEPYVYTNGLNYTYSTVPSEALKENPTLNVAPGLYYEFVVPEGELFVMGDHRNDSTDSRDIGTVRVDAVLGRVVLRVLPFDKFGKVE